MQNKQRYITASVTLAAAAVTAHLMQSGGSSGNQANTASVAAISVASAATVQPEEAAKPARQPNAVTLVAAKIDAVNETASDMVSETVENAPNATASLPRPPKDVLMPAPLPQVGATLDERMADSAAAVADPIVEEPARNQFGLTCGPILSASPKDSAMVTLTLTAPCRGDERIAVQHGDLTFDDLVDHLGTYTVEVPALSTDAAFTVTFPDGDSVSAQVDVPLGDGVERVALISSGDSGLQIHALEFGAEYGDQSHIWSGNSRDAMTANQSGGGYMVMLGNAELENAQLAQIYTFPNDGEIPDGVVRLSVEAEVTAYNCEREVAGKTLELAPGGEVHTVAITVAVPACNAIGEYLVLKNLLRDLKIASN